MNFNYAAVFAVGAVMGSAVSWYVTKKKYEKIAQDEIDSVKEVFSKRETSDDSDKIVNIKLVEEAVENDDIMAYSRLLNQENYVDYSTSKNIDEVEAPYVISPDEYGEYFDYNTIELTYYADGVLTDDQDEPIGDILGTVGPDALNSFGKYEDDSVHVRNDRRKCDYEILCDTRNFSDIG